MEEVPNEKKGINWSIQDVLSLGYLYLLIVGIAGESIYYRFLGINILSYSSIIDILLSPIVQLIRVPALAIIFLVIPGGFFFIFSYMGKRHEKKKEDPAYRAKKDFEKLDQSLNKKNLRTGWLIYTMFIVFGGYIGFGLGGGGKLKKRIKEGELKPNRIVHFIDGEQKEVNLVGHNSDYLFYVEKGHKKMTVAPIPGNVKMIARMEDEAEQKE